MDSCPNILVVAGPTASGKSEMSVRLAEQLGGEVINVDSVQIYKGFDIGSAKIPVAARSPVPHHLIDALEATDVCSAAQFVDLADSAIVECAGRQKLPVLCAGTTMYLTALLHGLVKVPRIGESIRSSIRERETSDLYSELLRLDPARAKALHPNDRSRITRAMEVVVSSGKSFAEALAGHAHGERRYRALILVLCWERTELYRRIDQRAALMHEQGVVEETRALVEAHGPALAGLKTLGYAQCAAFLHGTIAEDELVPSIAQETRRYAKRQMTYWRNEPMKRGWVARPRSDEGGVILRQGKSGGGSSKDFRVYDRCFDELCSAVQQAVSGSMQANEVWYLNAKRCLS